MAILVTGGAGYLGSHTCAALLEAGYDVVAIDNLSNADGESLRRVQEITGRELRFYKADLQSREAVRRVFRENRLDAVIHFAGFKAVAESVFRPMEYYHNNILSTLVLCEVMKEFNVSKLVFSSSATVYGMPAEVPIPETCPHGNITSPYGRSKAMLEDILMDIHQAAPESSVVLLRYFNPVGAHPSGKIGEDPHGVPANLLPFVTQVAIGKYPFLSVYGNDYDTPDGTCIRDFIHVTDLAAGHVAALKKLLQEKALFEAYNLGTGRGCSILELVHAFEAANAVRIRCEFRPRRPGDVPVCYADTRKALRELHWKAEKTLEDMCRDAYRWQQQNPEGYRHG